MIKKKYSKEKILDFLSENPNFFIENPNLLEEMNFPIHESHKGESNIVSFKDWIIASLKKKQKKIITNAKYNFLNQKRVYSAIISLTQINDFNSLMLFLNNELAKKISVDCLILASTSKEVIKYGGVYIEEKVIDSIFAKDQLMIMDAVDESLGIFKSFSYKLYSNALFSIDKNVFDSKSVLAFGSKEKMFISDKGSDLIKFLSQVFENKCLQLKNDGTKEFKN